MIATVNAVKFNQPLGSYKVTKLCVTTDKGDDKEYNIFTNAKFHNVVADLVAGDSVEIKLVKNGKYWNVDDVVKLDKAPASTGGAGKGTPSVAVTGNKDLAIARAVALKGAIELFSSMVTAGLVKKTLKPDAAQEEVFALVKKFERYCSLEEDLESITSDTSSLATGDSGDDYTETDFPE